MSFLDKIAPALHKGLGGHMRAGTIWRADSQTAERDAFNRPKPGAPLSFPCVGIVERNRSALVGKGVEAATIQDRDVWALFLLHNLPIDPQTEDEFAVSGPVGEGERFRIVAVLEMDPARAHCVVQGRPVR